MNFGVRVGQSNKGRSEKCSKIVTWIREKVTPLKYFDDDKTIDIMVTELACTDPECVPLETLICVLGSDARWTRKILKPMGEVTEKDCEELPYPPSWTMWKNELSLSDANADLYANIAGIADSLESLVAEASVSDGRLALAYLENVIAVLKTGYLSNETEDSSRIGRTPTDVAPSDKNKDQSVPIIPTTTIPMMAAMNNETGSTDIINTLPHAPAKMSISSQPSSSSSSVSPPLKVPTMQTLSAPPAPSANNNMFRGSRGGGNGSSATSASSSTTRYLADIPPVLPGGGGPAAAKPRHEKGVRPRGCPCCDPDNIDNIVDKMLFLETPP